MRKTRKSMSSQEQAVHRYRPLVAVAGQQAVPLNFCCKTRTVADALLADNQRLQQAFSGAGACPASACVRCALHDMPGAGFARVLSSANSCPPVA